MHRVLVCPIESHFCFAAIQEFKPRPSCPVMPSSPFFLPFHFISFLQEERERHLRGVKAKYEDPRPDQVAELEVSHQAMAMEWQ